jgi:hypothetical protein
MTVEVIVDDQIRSGTSVIEARLRASLGDKGWTYRIWPRGKYPIVDLGTKGWLIASHAPTFGSDIKNPSKGKVPYRNVFQMPFRDLHARLPKIEVGEKYLPRFVWLPRETTLRDGAPLEAADFGRVIGRGVRLHRVLVEPTRDPLGWPSGFKEPEWLHTLRTNPPKGLMSPGEHRIQIYQVERD